MTTTETTETVLRESVRKALAAYRDFHAEREDELGADRDHHLTSRIQVESAMRILWMEN